ncbi:MAG TPA: DUF4215 domain-containing protein, partial [Polyangiaceae bacterium]|nr:DUF4215 domain-containing protein [Polyangiaceae bacterium]
IASAKQHLTATDGSTGVVECDSYLDQYETCMQAVLPGDQFNQLKSGIVRQRTNWRTLHDSGFKQAALAKICREATDLTQREFPTCTFTGGSCGNGVVNPGEQCDDGNRTAGDGCSPTCTKEPICGDGVVNGSEQCDDGNTTSGDGCSATCTIEGQCGNGIVNSGEQCDDGNTTSGDGCSAACTIESICGDGVVNGGEQCDDGNTTSGDGCSATCAIEPRCNDGTKNGSETDVDCGASCGATCTVGKACLANADCTTNNCSGGVCAAISSCTAATATDLGAPNSVTNVPTNACLRVQNGYPSWWGTNRSMQLQTQTGGSYPVPFTWSSSCKGTSGSNTFSADWQTRTIGPTSSQCATVIKLNGTGAGTIRLTYFGA